MIEPLLIYVGLVLARVGTFIMVLPLLGGTQTPRLVKLGLALALTVLFASTSLDRLGSVAELLRPQAAPWAAVCLALAREAGLGALIGFAFSLFLLPARIAGEFLAQEVGLSFGSLITASGDGSAGPLAVLFESFAGLLFLGLDVHHTFLGVLHESLGRYPVGQGFRLPTCDLVAAAGAAEEWGLLLGAPVALCLFLTTIVLALLTRAAPQLNLYTVGFPLRMLVGLGAALLFLPQLVEGLVAVLAQFTAFLTHAV